MMNGSIELRYVRRLHAQVIDEKSDTSIAREELVLQYRSRYRHDFGVHYTAWADVPIEEENPTRDGNKSTALL